MYCPSARRLPQPPLSRLIRHRPDRPRDLYQTPPIQFPVIPIHLTDILTVRNLFREGRRVEADVGCNRVSRPDEAGIIHETMFGIGVGAEGEGAFAEADLRARPPEVFVAVCGDAEEVMMLVGERAFSPARFDGGLGEDDNGVEAEGFPGFAGRGKKCLGEGRLCH